MTTTNRVPRSTPRRRRIASPTSTRMGHAALPTMIVRRGPCPLPRTPGLRGTRGTTIGSTSASAIPHGSNRTAARNDRRARRVRLHLRARKLRASRQLNPRSPGGDPGNVVATSLSQLGLGLRNVTRGLEALFPGVRLERGNDLNTHAGRYVFYVVLIWH